MFNEEIQDSLKKWRQNEFWKKSVVDSADTLGVKTLDEITVCHTVSEINEFLCFWENTPVDSGDTLALKYFDEIGLYRTIFEIFTLFYLPLKSKMAAISCEY